MGTAWDVVAKRGAAGTDDGGVVSAAGELFVEIIVFGTPGDGVGFDGVAFSGAAAESFLSAAVVCDAAATVETVDGVGTPSLALLDTSLAVAAIDVRADAEVSEFKAGLEIYEVKLGLFEARDAALLLATLSVKLLAVANPVLEALEVCAAVAVLASDESVVVRTTSLELEVEGGAGSTAGLLAMELLLCVELSAAELLTLRSLDLVAAGCFAFVGWVAGAKSTLTSPMSLTGAGSVVFGAEPEAVAETMLGAGLVGRSGLTLKADDGTGCCGESLGSVDGAICVKVGAGKVSPGVINDAETDGGGWTIGG